MSLFGVQSVALHGPIMLCDVTWVSHCDDLVTYEVQRLHSDDLVSSVSSWGSKAGQGFYPMKLNIQSRQPGARNLVQEGSSPTVMLHLLMVQKSKLRSWSLLQYKCTHSERVQILWGQKPTWKFSFTFHLIGNLVLFITNIFKRSWIHS